MTPTILLGYDTHESGRIRTLFLLKMYGKMSTRHYHLLDDPEQERTLLCDISKLLSKDCFRIAGYSSRTFWSEVILRKAFQLGVAFPWYYQDRFGPRYRYADSKHLDIQDFLTDYGKMEKSQALGLIGAEKRDGIFGTVLNDALLLLRCDLLSGSITEEEHNKVIADFQTDDWLQTLVVPHLSDFRKEADRMVVRVST